MIVYLILAAVLAVAMVLAIVRLAGGPSMPDRAIALEVIIGIIIGAVAIHVAYSGQNSALPLLVVVSLLGFLGSVSLARFGTSRERY